jgi:hypothetical protein
MYSNSYLFGNFRNNDIPQKIINNYVINNNLEIKRNQLSSLVFNMEKNLIKLKYSVFLKITNFGDNFIIINDLKDD